MRRLIIGSRGSPLALRQTELVSLLIRHKHPGIGVVVEVIRTTGDRISKGALHRSSSTKGLFVKEIEEALLEGKIDLAVHSLKDMPTDLPAGLCLGAVPLREDPRDALITTGRTGSLQDLPPGSRVGTGSLRRQAQLRWHRPDIQLCAIRGNVDTRIRKMERGEVDAVVLAVAGLRRMSLESRIDYLFPVEEMIPAVAQGALALEIREDDGAVHRLLAPLEDRSSRLCVEAERAFLKRMGGGCQVAMGGHASPRDGEVTFYAFTAVAGPEQLLREHRNGPLERAADLALEAAERLLERMEPAGHDIQR